jgi:hypothetical protein
VAEVEEEEEEVVVGLIRTAILFTFIPQIPRGTTTPTPILGSRRHYSAKSLC